MADTKRIPIHYVEFKTKDLQATKDFYGPLFGWAFTDYGPTYTAFSNAGLEGGFEQSDEPIRNGALIVLYDDDLEGVLAAIERAGGTITQPIFSFPGGQRFHFTDPSGNELAVWRETA